jgi:uroporphyrinogen-III synthase
MALNPTVIVTRPAAQASYLLELLVAEGFAGVSVPMLRIEFLESVDPPDFRGLDTLIFISTNAVAAFAQSGHSRAVPKNVRVFGIGQQTVNALRDLGLVADGANALSTEGLLQAPWFSVARSVLVVKGEGGRQTLAATLSQRGSLVRSWEGYRRLGPEACHQAQLCDLLADSVAAVLTQSGETLANVLAAVNGSLGLLQGVPVIVPSQRVADAYNDMGLNLVVARSALDKDMVAALMVAVKGARSE